MRDLALVMNGSSWLGSGRAPWAKCFAPPPLPWNSFRDSRSVVPRSCVRLAERAATTWPDSRLARRAITFFSAVSLVATSARYAGVASGGVATIRRVPLAVSGFCCNSAWASSVARRSSRRLTAELFARRSSIFFAMPAGTSCKAQLSCVADSVSAAKSPRAAVRAR
jgi:hypothetical protein